MDLSMPHMDGLEAIQVIKEEFPKTGVLVLTAHQDLLLDAIRAGAAGYIVKGVGPDDLVGAVRTALAGESPVDQELVMRLLRQLAEEAYLRAEPQPPGSSIRKPEEHPEASLTSREREVLRLLPVGKTNRRIA